MDWGVHAYDPTGANGVDPRNGGIVGTVSYDTTRNELDPRYPAAEDWQPGISEPAGRTCTAPIDCGTNAGYALRRERLLRARGRRLRSPRASCSTPTSPRPGSARPAARRATSTATRSSTACDENVLVPDQETDGECLESFMQGVQFGTYPTDQGTPDANFGAAVDGNYGFGDGCFDGTLDATDPCRPGLQRWRLRGAAGAGDYLVEVAIPDDATGNPMYKVTREEDINIGNGDQIIPQVPPPACAGAAPHRRRGRRAIPTATARSSATATPTMCRSASPCRVDPDRQRHLPRHRRLAVRGHAASRCATPSSCELNNGKSIVPIFNLFTDVPIPSRLRGLIVDDINFSTDPRSTMYGEKAGVPFAPVGIYDFTNRLVTTVESDFNGIYDVLLPSTNHISCPTPSGVCANMYRFVGNDPGIPGALNPNYNPRYRTIATEFEACPGIDHPDRPRPDPGRRDRRAAGPAASPARCSARSTPRRRSCSRSRSRT